MKQITSYLPTNHVTDGSVDYTTQLQKAVNENEEVQFPDYPLMVNDRGIIPPSNRLLQNPNLVMKATALGGYNAIRLQKVDNVTINNAITKGDRQSHSGTAGEWGHGIAMYGASNITLNSPQADYCWGDGIYIAGKDGMPCKNITINNAICEYNRRNGISVASVIGLLLESPYCGFTSGVLPMSGIDIEPANNTDEIQGVVINNPTTTKSQWYGISIGLSELFGGTDKGVDIKIINWADSYSRAALRASVNLNRRAGTEKVSGTIDIINPYWKDNSIAPWQVDIRTDDIVLKVEAPLLRRYLTGPETVAVLSKKENLKANYKIT